MQQNGKIDGKFKIMNPIYDDKNFAEDPREIHPKTFHPEESVDTTLINSNNDNYSETDKSFIDEHINSDDPNKTASDSEITINSMEHHLSDSITSAENLNVKSCDCITRLESLKDEFNLKAINIKRNLVLETENLKGEITCIRKDIEPTFDKNLIETINQQKSVESKNRYLTLETEEGPTKNKNTRTDSPNTKVTVKQNAINTAAQNKQNSNDKTESDTLDKRKLPVTILLGDSMVKDIKDWKMSSHTRKVVVKHFSGAKTKDMKSYVIPTVRQKPDNIILHTGTNDLKTIDTPDEITMGILNLAMT